MPETIPATPSDNAQLGPYPAELAALVASTTYRPGWDVTLAVIERDPATTHGSASRGLTLIITTQGVNSYHHEQDNYRVNHFFAVPPATYNRANWMRWLFDQYRLVEEHECMEFFTIDGEKPYAPNHGPGENPYTIHEATDAIARATSFRGVVKTDG